MVRLRSRPRFKQVADELMQQIRGGEYAVGTRLPSEQALCRRFAVSRHTIRESLRILAQMGLVESRRGSGTRVLARHSPVQYRQFVQNIDDLLRYGDATRLEPYQCLQVHADDTQAARMDVAEGTALVCVRCLRFPRDGGPPMSQTEIWVAKPRGGRGERLLDVAEAVYVILEMVNVRTLERVEQLLEPEELDAERAKLLGVPTGTGSLRIERRFYGPRGKLIALAESTHPKGRYTYATVLTRAAD